MLPLSILSVLPPAAPAAHLLLAVLGMAPGPARSGPEGPREGGPRECRRLSRELTAHARLAGTVGSETGARFVSRELERAGLEVELDRRVVRLSHPRRVHVSLTTAEGRVFSRTRVFDRTAIPPGDVPLYNAWSASGRYEGEVLDVGAGLRADYERLVSEGIEVRGKAVLARYGGAYRGVKAELAELFGARALLLYDDPERDGPGQGAVHPTGPWKPGDAAQRGSISPLAIAPGDVSTPGWPSPAPGEKGRRLTDEESDARLPRILCTPLGADEALAIREAIAGDPGWRVNVELDLARELAGIVNVIGRLPGASEDVVVVGNHRDAWVRGAHDAGSGTVALLRAAQLLGERVADGWRPPVTILFAFWDAEEFGLVGSTEWGEAHAEHLAEHGIAYLNADAAVSGLRFSVRGTPGFAALLSDVLGRVPDPAAEDGRTLFDTWSEDGRAPELGLLGSGSDFTVFVHHLGLPALHFALRGNRGGHYHTRFDDFAQMDRFLDPTWAGHETAARFVDELVVELARRGRRAFDAAEAASSLARRVRAAGQERGEEGPWLGEERAERIASLLDRLRHQFRSSRRSDPRFFQELLSPEGLEGRPWYRNPFWAPSRESGYGAETLPELRAAAREGEEALERSVDELASRLEAYFEAGGASGGAPRR